MIDKIFNFGFRVFDGHRGDLHEDLQAYGMGWKHRVFSGKDNPYMIGAQKILMPYSYQSVIQCYSTEDLEKTDKFYFDDYYYLNGTISVFNYANMPVQLEHMLD